ncbi:MAG: DUF5615 family PIN-like protein [Pseudonocardiaceae bacterium]
MLRKAGHEAWTAADAGLYRAGDDDLTVYADNKNAVLISHDVNFSQPDGCCRRVAPCRGHLP